MSTSPGPRRLLSRGSWPETARIADVLRKETVGGLLLVAAVAALVWANSPWSGSYFSLRDVQVGPPALHLELTLGAWAADGLLAIFFFVAGLELKREFVAGDRCPRRHHHRRRARLHTATRAATSTSACSRRRRPTRLSATVK